MLLLWRWAVEIGFAVVVIVLVVKVDHHTGHGWRWSLLAVVLAFIWLAAVLLVWQRSRPVIAGGFWCLVTRHRMRAWFVEARVFNRTGRLPWIVFIRPTPVGERVWVWLVPGLSVEDFTRQVERLSVATWSRSCRVERSRRVGALVRVDVIRRDPLLVTSIPSVLIPEQFRDWFGGEDTPETDIGPLDLPITPVTFTGAGDSAGGRPMWGSPTSARSGKKKTDRAALSIQDGDVLPSTPPTLPPVKPVVSRGGEDVSDYV